MVETFGEIKTMLIEPNYISRYKIGTGGSEHQELITRIIQMMNGHTTKDFSMWCGRTKHLSIPKMRKMVLEAEKNGELKGRLFNFLLKESKIR